MAVTIYFSHLFYASVAFLIYRIFLWFKGPEIAGRPTKTWKGASSTRTYGKVYFFLASPHLLTPLHLFISYSSTPACEERDRKRRAGGGGREGREGREGGGIEKM